jgi:hypothetical protein
LQVQSKTTESGCRRAAMQVIRAQILADGILDRGMAAAVGGASPAAARAS